MFGFMLCELFLCSIVTVFGIGLVTKNAPGTVGSLFATILCIFFPKSQLLFFSIFICLFTIGVFSCQGYVNMYSNNKDPGFIVIDEVCAIFFINTLILRFYKYDIKLFILSFILFRIFDIWKPWPIRYMEQICKRIPSLNGLGIMFDDLLAGILTFIAIYIYQSNS